jgi:hypothetical protein
MFGRPGLSMLIPSKTAPRSTKNASSAGVTIALPPPLSGVTPPASTLAKSGIVFGPTLSGTTGASLAMRLLETSWRLALYVSL